MNPDTHLAHSFVRGKGEEIQIVLKKYKERYYIDLRLWFQDEGEKVFKPTQKGLCNPAEHLSDLQKGVEELYKLRDKLGEEKRATNAPKPTKWERQGSSRP